MPLKLFNKLIKRKHPKKDFVTIVSGLPRSGTSMLMNMLEASGMPVLTDHIRTADDDNPKGYYEFERVKRLPDGDIKWLADAQGKAVKVISALVEYLPSLYNYKVIFMRRDMEEILASQKQMLVRRSEPTDKVKDQEMAEMFQKHLAKVEDWLTRQPNMDVVYIHYNQVLQEPDRYLKPVVELLDGAVELQPMLDILDNKLYRQRR